MSIDKRIDKEDVAHTMEYYSATKNSEIMPSAAAQMDLDIIILSEVNQRQTNIIWYHLFVETENKK